MKELRFSPGFLNHAALMGQLYNRLCNVIAFVYDSSVYHGAGFYVPHRRGGGQTVFGAVPVGVGVSVGVTLSCLHDIS